jgi:hypothetical protein
LNSDLYEGDLLSIKVDRTVREVDCTVRLAIDELLQISVFEVLTYADYVSFSALNLFRTDKNERIPAPEGVGECQYVLQQLRLFMITGAGKFVLLTLEVERRAFGFKQQGLCEIDDGHGVSELPDGSARKL